MSRSNRTRLAVAGLVAVAAVAMVSTTVSARKGERDRGRDGTTAVAKLRDADGKAVARVVLRERRGGSVRVRVSARRLTPGFHGFHIHEKGVCEAPSESPEGKTGSFLSAGGHFARGSQGHGEHAGDMPPLFVTREGRARAQFEIDSYRVRELGVGDGSAIMIHADPDNSANIPERYRSSESDEPGPDEDTLKTGDSGDRVACGTVRLRRR